MGEISESIERVILKYWFLSILFLASCAHGPLEQALHKPIRTPASAAPRSLHCFQLAENLFSGNSIDILSRETLSLNEIDEQIRLTQFHYGSPRVDLLVNRFASWNEKKIQKYLIERPVPYVLGPDGKYYIVDRHHLHRALSNYQDEMRKRNMGTDQFQMTYERIADFSQLERDEFHEQMIQSKWMFPYYRGRFRNPDELPQKSNQLDEDFYRGLAWIVREGGGYKKTDIPFAEFYWGEYLRKHLHLPKDQENFTQEVILRAIELTMEENSTTRKLPGFISGREGLSPRSILYGSTKKLEEIGLSFGHVDFKHSLGNILNHIFFSQSETSKLQVQMWKRELKGKSLPEIQKIVKKVKIPYVRGPMGKKWILSESSLLKALFLKNDELLKEGQDLTGLSLQFREIEDMSDIPYEDFKKYLKEHGFLEKKMAKESRSSLVEDPRFLEDTKAQDLLYLAKLIKAVPKTLPPEYEAYVAKRLHKMWLKKWPKDKKIKAKRATKFFDELAEDSRAQQDLGLKDPPYKTKKIKKQLKDD